MATVTPNQVRAVQTARRQLRLDEDDYREILTGIGGVVPDDDGRASTKGLTQRGFEKVMAHFEHRGFRKHPKQPGGYWREREFRRDLFADARQVELMRELAAQARIGLPAFCLRMTQGRMDDPARIRPWEASNVIEGLKKIIARASAGKGSPTTQGKDAAGTEAGSGDARPAARTAYRDVVYRASPSARGEGQATDQAASPASDWFS